MNKSKKSPPIPNLGKPENPSLPGLEIDENQKTESKPQMVMCLGKTFESEEARREYFRTELRRLLPQLKEIDGFPIGEDEDIIALSDPPYYTACPNPWLNDFIVEWEKEKKSLEAQGKRRKDFEVKEPYTADVSEGKNNPIYLAHAYHTKVPHLAIMRYIDYYTQPGDLVLDGFCGTGMTGVAAQQCDQNSQLSTENISKHIGPRHPICLDISPAACHIAAGYTLPFDSNIFESKALSILEQVDKELGWMYKVIEKGKEGRANYFIWSDVYTCPNCNHQLVLWNQTVSLTKENILDQFYCPNCQFKCSKKTLLKVWESQYDPILGEVISCNKNVPVRVNFTLKDGTRGERDIDNSDIELLEKIISLAKPNKFTYKLIANGYNTRQPIESNGVKYTHQFYTLRNYLYLSRIAELIQSEPMLKLWFTSSLQSLSRMNRFRFTGTGITSGILYLPSLSKEYSPYNTLLKKVEVFKNTYYSHRGNGLVGVNSATNLSLVPNDIIDYIFVDPPFGANIMYSELNSIWEGWLNVRTENSKEAIVNPAQGKTLFEYQELMYQSLREFYRVLKPGKWLTMEFSNTNASVWNSIQTALQNSGFVVANVSALDKQQGSFKAVTTTTAVKQDLIISCYKPTKDTIESFERMNGFESRDEVKANVETFVDELLNRLPVVIIREKKSTAVVERSPKILYDRLIAFFVQRGLPIPMDAADFQKWLKEHFVEREGMYFTPEQALEYDDLRLENPESMQYSIFIGSESEGIQWLKRELKEQPQTYQDLQPKWMQSLVAAKKGDKIPELRQILDENFLKNEAEEWYIPDLEKETDLERVRTRRLLKLFEEYRSTKGKIKEARLDALRVGFKNCYSQKDFASIIAVGDRIPQNLLTEDEILLQYYDIATSRV